VADAKALEISIAWGSGGVVALYSQGVIQRVRGLMLQEPRSWVEGRLSRQMAERLRTLMWVKGHEGKEGNEMADTRAKKVVWMGEWMHMPDVVTLAGIRKPIHSTAKRHLT